MMLFGGLALALELGLGLGLAILCWRPIRGWSVNAFFLHDHTRLSFCPPMAAGYRPVFGALALI